MHASLDIRLLFRPEDAAVALDISRTTVYALIASGDLESVRIGRARRIPRAALDAYVDRIQADERFWSSAPLPRVGGGVNE